MDPLADMKQYTEKIKKQKSGVKNKEVSGKSVCNVMLKIAMCELSFLHRN